MCIRCLGFVLLIWCPGELHAQSATQSCSAPTLDGGKFSPKRETYANGVYVTYSCDLGRKPAVEGWWARSTCQNGTWSPQPQCILEEACIPPEIPNAKYTESSTGWYEDGQKIRITCDEAYELKATALCTNGSWSSVPVCERSVDACGEPPQISHAVIVNKRNQELFAADTELQYECEDGYTAEGAGNDKTIVCKAGAWTKGPTCRSVDACGEPPQISHAVIVNKRNQELFAADTELQYECEDGYTAEGAGNDKTIVCKAGAWTEGPTCSSAAAPGTGQGGSTEGATGGEHTPSPDSGIQPAGGGSSTTSDSNGQDSKPLITEIFHCRQYPTIANGAVVKAERMHLKYRCADYHTRVGSDTVVCYNNGSWSQLPVCKEPCVLNPAQYPNLRLSGFQRLREGASWRVSCIWNHYTSLVQCTNGVITHTQCCHPYDRSCP